MNISQLDMVNRYADARRALLHRLDMLATKPDPKAHPLTPPPFCVTIDGQRQDDTILELLRPVLHRELRARVHQIDADLAAMGVDVA